MRSARSFTLWCKRLDQRFERDEEAKFTKSLEPNFICPCMVCGFLVAWGCGSAAVSTHTDLKAANVDDAVFMLVMVGTRTLGFLSSAIMAVACLLKKCRCGHFINLERTCLAWVFSLVLVWVWFNAWHGSLLLGKEPSTVFPEWEPAGAEGYALLCLSMYVSGCCLIVPVRCHLSWIIPAFGFGSFACVSIKCGSASPGYLGSNLSSLIVIMGSTLWGSYKNERFLRREWLAQQKVGTQQDLLESQYDGVCRLLNQLCDCVIRLGSDLQLLEPNPKFAAMLLKTNSQSLMGTCIKGYIPDEADRELFSDMVVGKEGEASTHINGMFHVKFKDSSDKAFQVAVYHSLIANKDDIEYLVGIVENSEREPLPAMGSAALAPNIIGFVADSRRMPSSSGGSSGDDISGDVTNLSEVAVDILADPQEGFPIIRCSPGFTALSGPITEGELLAKFMENNNEFKNCVEEMLNEFYNSCQNVVVEDLVFRKPNSSIEYRISASSLDFAGITLKNDHESEIHMRAVFHGISQHRRSRRSRRGRRSPRMMVSM